MKRIRKEATKILSRACDGEWQPCEVKPKSKVVTLHYFLLAEKGCLCNQYKDVAEKLPKKIYINCPRCEKILMQVREGNPKILALRAERLKWPRHITPKNQWKPHPEKHTEEAKRKISLSHLGDKNPRWAGDHTITKEAGRIRARRRFGIKKGMDIHHIDGNTLNNDPSNLLFLSRREHMLADGRMNNLLIGRKKRIAQ